MDSLNIDGNVIRTTGHCLRLFHKLEDVWILLTLWSCELTSDLEAVSFAMLCFLSVYFLKQAGVSTLLG